MDLQGSSQHGYLSSDSRFLHASITGSEEADKNLLMLAPFGEERKCAYRLLAETAGLLAKDFKVMRFDYSGTGESTGDHASANLSMWLADAGVARDELEGTPWLLGGRLGANLALRLATEATPGIVLWEPLATGQSFLDEMMRRKQIKEMMGGGQASSLAEELDTKWEQGEAVDFDGFSVGASMASDLRALDLAVDLKNCACKNVLLLHITGAKKFSGPWAEIETIATERGYATALVRQKPFWGLLDYQEHTEIKAETQRWLCDPAGYGDE